LLTPARNEAKWASTGAYNNRYGSYRTPERRLKKIFQPFFFDSKICPKTQKIKFQNLEVSNSIRDGVRAFFGLLPNGKIKNFSK
jgi:hypothetical protein